MRAGSLPRWLLVLVPVLLIGGTAVLLAVMFAGGKSQQLREGVTYAVWLSEAEVAPRKADGSPWDADGTAPDLFAMIQWQDQIVLETVTDRDTLIARWEPVAVDLRTLLSGEVSTSSVKRVAMVRLDPGEPLVIGVFDNDLVGADFVGAFEVSLKGLRLGVNEVISEDSLRRLQIVVAESDSEGVPSTTPTTVDDAYIVWLDEPPSMMGGTFSRVGESARGSLEQMSSEAIQRLEKAAEEQGRALKDRLDNWLSE